MTKKFLLIVAFFVGAIVTVVSCTNDTAEAEVELFSPDDTTCPPGGCD